MDALTALLGRKTTAEIAVEQAVDDPTAATPSGKLPAPIGMMARMLGVQPNDMMQAIQMMAGAATALQDMTKRLEALQAQQTLMAGAMVAMNQQIMLLEQRSRPTIIPHGADDMTEKNNG